MIQSAGVAAFGAINSVFLLVDFIISGKEVGSENEVFVRTIQRVRYDLEETERLLRLPAVQQVFSGAPEQLEYITNVLFTTRNALNEIGLFIEKAGSDQERDGEFGFSQKLRWVLKDHGKLENRRAELAVSHQTLTTILNNLHPLELAAGLQSTRSYVVLQTQPPPTYGVSVEDTFIGPNQRRKQRSKPGIRVTLSQLETDEEQSETIQISCNAQENEMQSEWSTSLFRAVEELIKSGGQQMSTSSEENRIMSPTSCCGSSGSNNFGPVNPWDDWSSDAGTVKETQKDGSTRDLWSTSSDVSAFSNSSLPLAQHRTRPRSAIPSHYATSEGSTRFEGNAWPYESEEVAKSWVTVREPRTKTQIQIIEETYSANQPIGAVSEEPLVIPSRNHWGLRRHKKIDFPTPEDTYRQAEYVPTADPVVPKTTSWYRQPLGRSSRRFGTVPAVTLPTIPSETATYEYNNQHSFRPRSQTDINSRSPPVPVSRPISSSPLPLSSYQVSMCSSSMGSVLLRPPSEDDSNDSSSRQREYFSPDSITNKPSQSMRRKAVMEAAVGNKSGE